MKNAIGFVKEPLEETRICCTPKEVKQIVTQLQHDVFIENGYGEGLGISNEAFDSSCKWETPTLIKSV